MSPMPDFQEIRDFFTGFASRVAKLEEEALSTGLEERVTLSEIHIIEKIGPEGSAKMGNVARALGITLATLTVACDRLEEKELIERRRDAQDKRTVCISLTPRGLIAYHFHEAFHQHLIDVMMQGLSEEERAALRIGVRNLNRFFSDRKE